MKPGTKFRAIRKSTGKPAFKSMIRPDGLTLTVVDDYDGIITCEEGTRPLEGRSQSIQIFRKFWNIEEVN